MVEFTKSRKERRRDEETTTRVTESLRLNFSGLFHTVFLIINIQPRVLVVGGRVKINTKALPNCNPLYLPKGFKEFIIFGLFWQRNLFLSIECVRRQLHEWAVTGTSIVLDITIRTLLVYWCSLTAMISSNIFMGFRVFSNEAWYVNLNRSASNYDRPMQNDDLSTTTLWRTKVHTVEVEVKLKPRWNNVVDDDDIPIYDFKAGMSRCCVNKTEMKHKIFNRCFKAAAVPLSLLLFINENENEIIYFSRIYISPSSW